MITFARDPSLGNFRVASFAWEFQLGIVRLGIFVWDPSLGTFDWALSLGNFRSGYMVWELSLGSARLWSWAHGAGGTGRMRRGEPLGRSWGDSGGSVCLPGH